MKPGPTVVLIHRIAKGLSGLLPRPGRDIPGHLLVGSKDLAVPSKGGAVVWVMAARAFEVRKVVGLIPRVGLSPISVATSSMSRSSTRSPLFV